MDGECAMYIIILFIWIESLWEFYLAIRQYKLCSITKQVPTELTGVMTKDTFEKARLYSMDKAKFGMIKDVFMLLLTTMVIYLGIMAKIWTYSSSIAFFEGEVFTSCIWLAISTTASTIISLPFIIYYTFILEEKYGFNKQTSKFFVVDKIKGFILNLVLSMPLSALAVFIVLYGGDYFFVWLWITIGIFVLLLLTIYPSYIAPLFDKYTPLPDGVLKTRIEELAAKLKFPLADLYVVEGSKRSSHSNAYFYGLFKTKRIVLFDTLLKSPDSGGCDNDEVVAVLSHELGHWHHGHINKNLIIMQVNLFLMFAAFSVIFKYGPIYQAVGFESGLQPVLVGLVVVIQYVMMPYNALLSFLLTCLSRKFEFQADEFAVKLGNAEPLKHALVQLNKDNLGFPVYDHLYSAWHHSHPPLLERIEALKRKGD